MQENQSKYYSGPVLGRFRTDARPVPGRCRASAGPASAGPMPCLIVNASMNDIYRHAKFCNLKTNVLLIICSRFKFVIIAEH